MHAPRRPEPERLAAGLQAAGRPAAGAPHDLADGEAAVSELLGRAERVTPSAGLRNRCLAPGAGSAWAPADGYARPVLTGWVRPVCSYAAAALLGLGLTLVGGSDAPRDERAHPDSLAYAATTLRVVDDPSVPLFHGVETFQELALWETAVAGSRSPR